MDNNEYNTRLNELYGRLLTVNPKKCSAEFAVRYGVRTAEFRLCQVNGIRYVQAKDVAYMIVGRKETLFKHGILKESDMPYFYCVGQNRNQSYLFVNVEALAAQDLNMVIGRNYTDFYIPQARAVIEKALKEPVENLVVTADEFERGQQAYRDIQALRKEKRASDIEQKREQEEEYEREQEERRIEEGKQEERTLRDLVAQIEAMGWNVSLTLKSRGLM